MTDSLEPDLNDGAHVYDRYPALDTLLRDGGLPGVEYLLACADRLQSWRRRGYTRVEDVDIVLVKNIPLVLLGRGKPIRGASPLKGRCRYSVDREADSRTGLGPKTRTAQEQTRRADAMQQVVAAAPRPAATK